MTAITIDRAVVEQALEALWQGVKLLNYRGGTVECLPLHDAITALRAALAQEQPNPPGCDHCNHPLYAATKCRVCGRVTEQAEPVQELVAHRVVAGALFDFMGWLTSRRERLVLSSIDDAAPAADAIKDFAEMRGLSLDDAKVQDWNAALAQQAEQAEPVAWMYTGIKQDGTEHGPHLVWKPEYMDAMSASKGAKATPLYFAPPRQAEPVEPVAWVGDPSTQDYASTVPDTQIADRLARHGINPCPDCRGLGYDASGQLCWCQQNPSF